MGVTAALAEARDPGTPAGRLRALAEEFLPDETLPDRRAIVAALAANPNTPAELLPGLFSEAPLALLRNPALPLLALERPDLGRELDRERARALLLDDTTYGGERHAAGRAALAALVAAGGPAYAGDELPEEARMHVSVAGEVPPGDWRAAVRDFWLGYAAGRNDEVRCAVAEFADLGLLPLAFAATAPPDPFADRDGEGLATFFAAPEERRLLQAPVTPDGDPAPWRRLVASFERAVRSEGPQPAFTGDALLRLLARQPQAPAALLRLLVSPVDDADAAAPPLLALAPPPPSLRRLIARHPNAPVEVIRACREEAIRSAAHWVSDNALCRFALLLAGLGAGDVPSSGGGHAAGRVTAACLAPLDRLRPRVQDPHRVVRAAARARRTTGEPFAWPP